MLERLFALWRTKLAFTLIVTPLTLVPYLLLQRYRAFEPRTFDLTAIDRAAGFAPAWVWIYISYYVPLVIAPWISVTREQIRRFIVGWFIIAAIAWMCFFFYPVDGPRPPASKHDGWAYRLLVMIDEPGNAFPSLHLAFMVYALLFVDLVLRDDVSRLRRAGLLIVGWLWVAAVGWSTMATKQHYFVDVTAGAALAFVGYLVVFRRERKEPEMNTDGHR